MGTSLLSGLLIKSKYWLKDYKGSTFMDEFTVI